MPMLTMPSLDPYSYVVAVPVVHLSPAQTAHDSRQ